MRNLSISLWIPLLLIPLGFLITVIAGVFLISTGHSAQEFKPILAPLASVLGIVLVGLSIVINFFAAIQRFHDIGKPASHVFLLLIPVYNIYLWLSVLINKPSEGVNKYGPVPTGVKRKKVTEWVFVLSLFISILLDFYGS